MEQGSSSFWVTFFSFLSFHFKIERLWATSQVAFKNLLFTIPSLGCCLSFGRVCKIWATDCAEEVGGSLDVSNLLSGNYKKFSYHYHQVNTIIIIIIMIMIIIIIIIITTTTIIIIIKNLKMLKLIFVKSYMAIKMFFLKNPKCFVKIPNTLNLLAAPTRPKKRNVCAWKWHVLSLFTQFLSSAECIDSRKHSSHVTVLSS